MIGDSAQKYLDFDKHLKDEETKMTALKYVHLANSTDHDKENKINFKLS